MSETLYSGDVTEDPLALFKGISTVFTRLPYSQNGLPINLASIFEVGGRNRLIKYTEGKLKNISIENIANCYPQIWENCFIYQKMKLLPVRNWQYNSITNMTFRKFMLYFNKNTVSYNGSFYFRFSWIPGIFGRLSKPSADPYRLGYRCSFCLQDRLSRRSYQIAGAEWTKDGLGFAGFLAAQGFIHGGADGVGRFGRWQNSFFLK